MEFVIKEQEVHNLAAILENTPWKYAQPAMDILRVVIARANEAKKLAEENAAKKD